VFRLPACTRGPKKWTVGGLAPSNSSCLLYFFHASRKAVEEKEGEIYGSRRDSVKESDRFACSVEWTTTVQQQFFSV